MVFATDRQAALAAAAAVVGPAIPGGIVNQRPDDAVTAVTRLADLFLSWLTGDEQKHSER